MKWRKAARRHDPDEWVWVRERDVSDPPGALEYQTNVKTPRTATSGQRKFKTMGLSVWQIVLLDVYAEDVRLITRKEYDQGIRGHEEICPRVNTN